MSDTEQLAALLTERYDVLKQLCVLGKRQLTLAGDAEAGAIIGLLAAKQGLIDRLMRIEAALAPFRTQSPDQRHWKTQEDRAKAAAISNACDALLKEVMELDRQGLEKVQARQQQSKLQIDSAHQAASARSAYLTNEASQPRSIDIASGA